MFETSRCKLSTVLLISDGAFQSFIFSFIEVKELYILSYSGSKERYAKFTYESQANL